MRARGSLALSPFPPWEAKEVMISTNFDAYTWRARIIPVFLAVFPLAVAVALWVPDLALIGRLAGMLLVPFGVAMLMSQIGRDLGKRREPRLWQRWGGAPTTQLLRHRNDKANPIIRERYHKKLVGLQPDLTLPTAEEEERDAVRADHAYEACVRYLITKTRDRKQFPLLFSENVNYGFRRNLWGMKPFGALFSLAGLATCALYLRLYWENFQLVSAEASAGAFINLALFLFWLFWVTPSWVRIAGDAYAERLLETCEELQGKS